MLPSTIFPQQIHLRVGTPGFQTVDRFRACDRLAAERRIEVHLTAEQTKTARWGDPLLGIVNLA
jgi:hypothetical protein